MNYDEIIAEIRSGLTGDSTKDQAYLREQFARYSKHALSEEILWEIGRMFGACQLAKQRSATPDAGEDLLSVRVSVEKANVLLKEGKNDEAEELLAELAAHADAYLSVLYVDDADNEYHSFSNILEEALFMNICKPAKLVHPVIDDVWCDVYYSYAFVLIGDQDLDRYDEARETLQKAIRINPVGMDVLFELTETYKIAQDDDEAILELAKRCLRYAYSRPELARCYENLAFYYLLQEQYDVAAVLFYLSLFFDPQSEGAMSWLTYIMEKTGQKPKAPSRERIVATLEAHDIQFGPNKEVLDVAFALGQRAEREKDYDDARHYWGIVFELTLDDDVKKMIDSLPLE